MEHTTTITRTVPRTLDNTPVCRICNPSRATGDCYHSLARSLASCRNMQDNATASLFAAIQTADTAATRAAAARAIREYVGRPADGTWQQERARQLATTAWCDTLARVCATASTDTERRWACDAMCAITYDIEGVGMFGQPCVRDALVVAARAASTDEAREWVARAMCNVAADRINGQRVMSSECTRDAIVSMAHAAGTEDARRWIASAVKNVALHNPLGRNVFGTAGVRDALVAMAHGACTDDARHSIADAIVNLAHSSIDCGRVFGTDNVRTALAAMARVSHSNSALFRVVAAMGVIAPVDYGACMRATHEMLVTLAGLPHAVHMPNVAHLIVVAVHRTTANWLCIQSPAVATALCDTLRTIRATTQWSTTSALADVVVSRLGNMASDAPAGAE